MATRNTRRHQQLRDAGNGTGAGPLASGKSASRNRKALLAHRAAQSQAVTTLVQALQMFGPHNLAGVA